jgi:hypothetical protein
MLGYMVNDLLFFEVRNLEYTAHFSVGRMPTSGWDNF